MKEMYKQNEKKIRYCIVILGGVLLTILLLILSFYNQPSADDFNYSVNVRQYGLFRAQLYCYTFYNGRYFAAFLQNIDPLVQGSFLGYKLMSFILIIFSLASFYFVINTFFNRSGLLEKLYIVFLCFFSFLLLMPSVAEAYYWVSGAYTYQTGNILTLFFIGSIMLYKAKPSKKYYILSAIVLTALIGTNETSMLIIVMLILFINMLQVIRNKKVDSFFLVLLAIALVCLLVVFLAPGNTNRMSQTNNHQFLFSLKSSISEALDVLSNWWWIGAFIIFTTYKITTDSISEKTENRFESVYLNPFLVLFLIFGTVAAGFFTCYWSLGLYPPMRMIDTIYFNFIIGSVYTGICIAVKLKKSGIKIPDIPFSQMLVPLLLMVYVYKYQNNVSTAYFDFKHGIAQKYDEELMKRYDFLYKSDCKTCEVEKIKHIPKTLYFNGLDEKTDFSMVESYSKYFGKDWIKIKP